MSHTPDSLQTGWPRRQKHRSGGVRPGSIWPWPRTIPARGCQWPINATGWAPGVAKQRNYGANPTEAGQRRPAASHASYSAAARPLAAGRSDPFSVRCHLVRFLSVSLLTAACARAEALRQLTQFASAREFLFRYHPTDLLTMLHFFQYSKKEPVCPLPRCAWVS